MVSFGFQIFQPFLSLVFDLLVSGYEVLFNLVLVVDIVVDIEDGDLFVWDG